MTHASLFSGIGGPEIAAEMLGWENIFHCEINPFGLRVLEYWYPNSKSYEDITRTDFTEWRGRIDVLTGGFPCQPFSCAGKRGGASDDRYLWPEMLRAIQECQPAWVVGENVAGITSMVEQGEVVEVGAQASLFGEEDALRSYELRERYTIERICTDLERIGYEVQPVLIPACAVGAPHRRDRIFIIGYRNATNTDRSLLQQWNSERTSDSQSRHRVEPLDSATQGTIIQTLSQNPMRGGQSDAHGEQGRERNEWNAGTGDSERLCFRTQRTDVQGRNTTHIFTK